MTKGATEVESLFYVPDESSNRELTSSVCYVYDTVSSYSAIFMDLIMRWTGFMCKPISRFRRFTDAPWSLEIDLSKYHGPYHEDIEC